MADTKGMDKVVITIEHTNENGVVQVQTFNPDTAVMVLGTNKPEEERTKIELAMVGRFGINMSISMIKGCMRLTNQISDQIVEHHGPLAATASLLELLKEGLGDADETSE